MRRTTWIFFTLLTFSLGAWADYAWITDYQRLQLKLGFDGLRTTDNYDNNGNLTTTRVGSQNVGLSDRIFWLEPEVGIAKDWAMGMRASFIDGSVDNNTAGAAPLLSGSGLGDLRFNFKWQASVDPLWTIETYFKFPNAPSRPVLASDLVWGEGNVDIGIKAHYGFRSDAFYFSVSPGLLGRLGGYSSALTLDAAVQAFIQRAYVKLFAASIFSFSPQGLPPSTTAGQTLNGTGGSYARLAASPTGVEAGGSVGALFTRNLRLEAGASHSVWGQRYPSYFHFTVSLLALFDFATPDLRPKLRSVPFENVPSDL